MYEISSGATSVAWASRSGKTARNKKFLTIVLWTEKSHKHDTEPWGISGPRCPATAWGQFYLNKVKPPDVRKDLCPQAVGFVEKYLVTIELIGSWWLLQLTLWPLHPVFKQIADPDKIIPIKYE